MSSDQYKAVSGCCARCACALVVLHASAVRILIASVCLCVNREAQRVSGGYFCARQGRNLPHTCWAGLALWVEGVSRAGFSSLLLLYLLPDYITRVPVTHTVTHLIYKYNADLCWRKSYTIELF